MTDTQRNGTEDAPSSTQPPASQPPVVEDAENYRLEWARIQTGFVDEPRRALECADALVAEVVQELATSFARERNKLESQWSQGEQASTEDLRLALQRYRSFFDRLLAA